MRVLTGVALPRHQGRGDRTGGGIKEIEASFRRLRVSRVDLIAVHNLRDAATQLRTLRELKQAGRIRYVGTTTSFPRQYPDFERTMRAETLDFIQVDYALDNRAAADGGVHRRALRRPRFAPGHERAALTAPPARATGRAVAGTARVAARACI